MKKLLFFCAALTATFTATGQHYYTDSANPDITRHSLRIAPQRVEFVLPEVGGYTVYKADLHTHSIYSDGDCTPEFRVREAWYDGLDELVQMKYTVPNDDLSKLDELQKAIDTKLAAVAQG